MQHGVAILVLTLALPRCPPQASWCSGLAPLLLTSPACPSSSAVMASSGMTISTLCLLPCVHPRY